MMKKDISKELAAQLRYHAKAFNDARSRLKHMGFEIKAVVHVTDGLTINSVTRTEITQL